jgi:RNA polymerase sigma-70 factor (ECF subfamily)
MRTYKELTDGQLVTSYQDTQNSDAFAEIYDRYNQKVFAYSLKILADRDNAMDVTQDVFLKVSHNIEKLKDACTFVKWLFIIAHNLCIDLLKERSHGRCIGLENSEVLEAEIFNVEEALLKEKEIEYMEIVLDRMPEKDRVLVVEKYFQKMSILDLMEKYGISESAVKMRLSRSRDKLKEMMTNWQLELN